MGWLESATINLPEGVPARIGLVYLGTVRVGPSGEALKAAITAGIAPIVEAGPETPETWKKGVRGLLRAAGFKPTGRNKPASEYLMQTLGKTGEFPFINTLVDINNLLSLQTYLPMSVLDVASFEGALEIRCGAEGEKYVFNPSGQEIDLKHLMLTADRTGDGADHSRAMGNAIKDSMHAKLQDNTTRAVAIIYAPHDLVSESDLDRVMSDWRDLVSTHADGADIEARQLEFAG